MKTAPELDNNTHFGTPGLVHPMVTCCLSIMACATTSQYQSRVVVRAAWAQARAECKQSGRHSGNARYRTQGMGGCVMAKWPPKALPLKLATDLMRKDGTRLILMYTPKSPEGKAYYVVPGGYIEPTDALKIIARPDVRARDDGLFPNCTQSWRLGGD